jgi:uncharacterized membrane protein YraQ (UPF0718 family)
VVEAVTTGRMAAILLAAALALGGLAWARGGPALAFAGLERGAGTLATVVPLLLAAFLISGLIQALITHDTVSRWMGDAAGWRGIGLGCLAGGLTPGGPYVYYPIAAALLRAGANLGVLVAFVTAKTLWSATRIPIEIALLGPHLTLVRLTTTLALPPLLGAIAQLLFGRYRDRIRRAVQS